MTQTEVERRKPAEPASGTKTGLKRELGLWSLVGLGVGGIIGSGVFALAGVMGQVAGPSFILAVILVGGIASLLAIIYAELGSAFPISGGPYSIPRMALGDGTGFVMGWGYFLYAFIGTAAIIDIFIGYAGFYIPGLANGFTLTPLGIGIAVVALWVFTAINYFGIKWGGLFGIVTTIGKLAPLLIFAVVGLSLINFSNFSPFFTFGWSGIALAMAFEFWAFTGFEAVVIPSEEVKSPSRTIPRAMLITMGVVIGVYVLISVAFTGLINWSGLGLSAGNWGGLGTTTPLADVSKAAGFAILAAVVTIGAIFSTAGAGGNWVLFQARIPHAMARDGLFWNKMGKVHSKYGTPFLALIFASALTMVIQILIPNFPSVALLASITTLIPYAAAAVALPVLRRTKPNAARPFKVPAAFAFSAAGFVLASLLIYWASWPWTLIGGVLTLIGFPLFLLLKNHKLEVQRNLWVLAYIIGLMTISLLGDTNFVFQNFLPISPLGIITMPYDMIVVVAFSLAIFIWAYVSNVRVKEEKQVPIKQIEP
jgi:basic amino acid/polyamine antiporter, APA family